MLTDDTLGETNELYLNLVELLFSNSISNADQDLPGAGKPEGLPAEDESSLAHLED